MKLVTAVIRPHKLDDVKDALSSVGLTAMTVTTAQGFGRQAGHREIYRGTVREIEAVPRIRVEMVVSDDTMKIVVDCIVDAAETEIIGDGKIWITPVEDIIRIRTGEMGEDAL